MRAGPREGDGYTAPLTRNLYFRRDCARKMNKLLTTVFGLAVALATCMAQAQDVTGSAEAGARKNAMCMGCHGIVGYQSSFPEVYKVPKIAGQGATYIAAALHEYKKGERKFPTMRAVASSLSDQDIADLAAYYSQLGVKSDAAPPPATPRAPTEHVKALLARANCASCHGVNFDKPIEGTMPKLAGQYPDYLFVALKSYKTENNPRVGRSNAIMGAMAKQYTDAELKAMARYIGSLPGDIKTVPESEIHGAR